MHILQNLGYIMKDKSHTLVPWPSRYYYFPILLKTAIAISFLCIVPGIIYTFKIMCLLKQVINYPHCSVPCIFNVQCILQVISRTSLLFRNKFIEIVTYYTIHQFKVYNSGTSLVVQWLRLHVPSSGGGSSTPGWET